ncbi:MAG: polymer-forming cytoskeletal protein [Candidatus Acidiferrales bacterium]
MWNKPAEGNVSPQASNAPAQVPLGSKTSLPAPTGSAFSTSASTTAASAGSSTISAGLRIHGEFSGNADLYIDGEAQGSIRLGQSKVTVGPHGHVQADIDAREILIEGTVHGNLKASESIHLGPGSRVQGSMLTPRVAIEDGARLRGKVEMTKPGDARRAGSNPKGSEVTPIAAAPASKD